MKLLIPVFSPATGIWGGLTRVVAVARAAEAAGHQLAFCASGSLEPSLRRHGYTVYSMPAATFLGLPPSLSRIVEQRSQRATLPVRPARDFGTIWLVLLISGMAKAGYLKRLVAAELAAARDFGAEFVFTDLDLGAFLTPMDLSRRALAVFYLALAAVWCAVAAVVALTNHGRLTR